MAMAPPARVKPHGIEVPPASPGDVAQPVDVTAADALQAKLAFDFQVATKKYPSKPVGDPVATSAAMRSKYGGAFLQCH